jgi:hypothetical protein
LKGGRTAQTLLRQTMQLSLDADEAFLRWAQNVHCHGHHRAALTSDYRAGVRYSAESVVPRRSFESAWSTIVAQAQLPALGALGRSF